MRSAFLSVGTLLIVVLSSRSAEPERLPPPRPVPASPEVLPRPAPLVEIGPMGTPVLPGYWRRSQYDKWQMLSVDREGFFRPRVLLTPHPYYVYDGKPYPWLSTRPLDVSPSRR